MSKVWAEQPVRIDEGNGDSVRDPKSYDSLDILRLLTDINQYREHMLPDGTVTPDVAADIKTNVRTGLYEMAIPRGVTTTIHKVEYREVGEQRRKRVITWLGKTSVENAIGGKLFHWSTAAHKRVDIEIEEAEYTEDTMSVGIAQAFISPKMSRHDADADTAKSEHLHDDDSLRVSFPVTNAKGEIVARRLESLLVSDVSLEDWVAMLKSPTNIFGKSFTLIDEKSATTVMGLFRELQLPEASLPNGPVDLVAAVLPYIQDQAARSSVADQLDDFRHKQTMYRKATESATEEGFSFIAELAKSLERKNASYPIRQFIEKLSQRWGDDDLRIISANSLGDTQYRMTTQLAARLISASQKVIAGKVSIATDNKKVLSQLDAKTVQKLKADIHYIEVRKAQSAPIHEVIRLQSNLDQGIADQNIKVGGGCPGDNMTNFNFKDELNDGSSENKMQNSTDWDVKANRSWKLGFCQVKACPSRPSVTEVGPCDVCRRCQFEFDAGRDPTSQRPSDSHEKALQTGKIAMEYALFKSKNLKGNGLPNKRLTKFRSVEAVEQSEFALAS